MFTRILQVLIYFFVGGVILISLLIAQAFGSYDEIHMGIFMVSMIIGLFILCVMGTFMEISLTLKNIESKLDNLSIKDNSIEKNIENKILDTESDEKKYTNHLEEDINSIICTNCNNIINKNAKFCPKCGNSL